MVEDISEPSMKLRREHFDSADVWVDIPKDSEFSTRFFELKICVNDTLELSIPVCDDDIDEWRELVDDLQNGLDGLVDESELEDIEIGGGPE